MTKDEVAKIIDHTLLTPNVKSDKIKLLCKEAIQYGFGAVCINPVFVKLAVEQLKGSDVKVCTVVGFPLGATSTAAKAFEAETAINDGADEVDMVIDLNAAIDKRFDDVEADIKAVVESSKKSAEKNSKKVIVKTILETCYLSDAQIEKCCIAAKNAGADFVKTSTGFATPKGIDGNPLPNGASEHHVKLMRKTVGEEMGVKASGGIRSARTARDMIKAGANRIGTSSGVNILETWL